MILHQGIRAFKEKPNLGVQHPGPVEQVQQDIVQLHTGDAVYRGQARVDCIQDQPQLRACLGAGAYAGP